MDDSYKETRLHDPTDEGVMCDGPYGDVFLPYTDDPYLIGMDLGIDRENAESTLELQEKPQWQPSIGRRALDALIGRKRIDRAKT